MRLDCVLTTALICLTILASGCGKNEEKPQAKTKAISATPPITVATQPIPETPQTPVSLEPPNALAGTTWKLSEFEIQFRDNTRILVKGGELGKLNPNGVEGRYTLKEGVLEISVMGQSRTGTFDEKGLVVEGAVGEKVNKQGHP